MLAALIVSLLFSATVFAQKASEEKAISSIMQTQQNAWNRGDLEAFMQPYWKSDSLVFVGSSGPVYGWQQTLDNYKKNYNSPEKMGQLSFTLLRIKPLGKNHYQVIGKWQLTRQAGNVGGHFTLVFEKIKGTWVIISDHSS